MAKEPAIRLLKAWSVGPTASKWAKEYGLAREKTGSEMRMISSD